MSLEGDQSVDKTNDSQLPVTTTTPQSPVASCQHAKDQSKDTAQPDHANHDVSRQAANPAAMQTHNELTTTTADPQIRPKIWFTDTPARQPADDTAASDQQGVALQLPVYDTSKSTASKMSLQVNVIIDRAND
jgi:hypothetical protein